jgi:hypothetical protein
MILGFKVFNSTLFKTYIPCCNNINTIVFLNPSSPQAREINVNS